MRYRAFWLLILILTAACNPMSPAPTPTLVPMQLPDPGMQQAALAAVQEYARLLDYQVRNPSFAIVQMGTDQVLVHVTTDFQTRKGFPYETYDALFFLRKTNTTWQADRIQKFSKLEWEHALQRGPVTLKSAAGFTIDVPSGWAGYVAPASELSAVNVCGVGTKPVTGVPLAGIMPAGYSAENVPVVLRVFQQCPRAPSLGAIRQYIEAVRAGDKTLRFEKLETIQLGGLPAVYAVVTDANGTTVHDFYVLHRERQLEFVLQAYPDQDIGQLLDVINRIRFE